jgi:DNA (cytosine-5)-methyltransferase 1
MKLWRPGDDELCDDFVACPNGLVLPADVAEKRYVATTPKAVDLFCGCGGFSLGMIQAGFEVVAAVEWDETAACTYMCNLCRWGEFNLHFVENSDRDRLERYLAKQFGGTKKKATKRPSLIREAWAAGTGAIAGEPRSVRGCTNFIFGDITKLTGARLLKMIGMKRGEIDCVVGSPPCQGFSVVGKRDPKDPRNNLVFEWVRLVLELHPKSCVMENVPGILSQVTADGLSVMDVIMRALEDGSFNTIDMLRKAIALQTGNVGFLNRGFSGKRKKGKKAKQKAAKKKPPARAPRRGDVQLAMEFA